MNADGKKCIRFVCVYLCASAAVLIFGCGHPNKANVELRKQNQSLQSELADLKRQHEVDLARIRDLESSAPTVPTLPPERLEKLVTTYGLKVGRLTGGADFDPNQPGDEGLNIHVAPVDRTGEPIKAAGSFVVEAFDLSRSGDTRIGRWEFPIDQVQKYWVNFLTQTNYVLPAPWQNGSPQHPEITVKVTFTDELTGRQFEAQKVVHVKLATPNSSSSASTQPSS
jgi:hypothetical protein